MIERERVSTKFLFLHQTHLYNLQHLCLADVAVAIQVVHAEGPLQLLVQAAAGGHTQGDDKLPEVYRAVVVGIECAEDVLGEFGGVSVREEVAVDLLELLHGECAAGAVPQEALVPLCDLMLGEVGVLHQVLHDLGAQLAVLFSHFCSLGVESVGWGGGGGGGGGRLVRASARSRWREKARDKEH